MKLTDLPNEFPDDKGDWVCWIEVRSYGIDNIDEDDYDTWGNIPIVYICKAYDGIPAWIKVSENDSFFKENEDFDGLRFFFINGSLNKGGYDEVEVEPVANFYSMVYFEPVKK